MIDIHSHILPGIDDGSKNINMTLEMLRQAVEDGTKKIIATPHFCREYAEEPYENVKELVKKLNILIKSENLNIDVYHGQEIYYTHELLENLKSGEIGSLNDTKYLLIELPMHKFDEEVFDVFYELRVSGYFVVLAHPERYSQIIKEPSYINRFIEEEVLFQMNAGSILGNFGKDVKKTSEILLNNNIYNFVGSDAHNIKSRNTKMKQAFNLIEANYRQIIEDSSIDLIENKDVEFIGEKIKEKKLFFSFMRKR